MTVTSPRSIATRIETADQKRTTTMTVAADDQTATYVALDERPNIAGPLRTEYLAKRVAAAPAHAHPVSGSWLAVRYVEVPEAYRLVELDDRGGTFTRSSPSRGHYTAAYDGTPAPLEGVQGASLLITVHKPDDHTVVETIIDHDKITITRTYTLSADGRSLETATRNKAGEVFRITSHRK